MTQKVSCWPSVNCQFLLVSQIVLNDTLPSDMSSCTPLLSHGGAAWPWRRLLAPPTSKSAAGALMEHFHLESWGSSLSTEQLNFTWGPEETSDGVLIPQVKRYGCEGTLPSCLTGSSLWEGRLKQSSHSWGGLPRLAASWEPCIAGSSPAWFPRWGIILESTPWIISSSSLSFTHSIGFFLHTSLCPLFFHS